MAEHIEYQGSFSGSQIDTLLTKIQSSQVFTTEEKTKLASLVNYDDTEVKEDISDIETSLNSHKSNKANPHEVTKAQVGLGNVDNTSDANKPISTATRTALASLTNSGAKNLTNFKFAGVVPNENIKPGTIVCTENNGVFSFSGMTDDKNYAAYVLKQCPVKAGKYIVSGISGGSNTTYWMRFGSGTGDAGLFNLYDGTRELNLNTDMFITVQFVIYTNQTISNLVIKPMLCTEEDYKISPEFVPYAPTNRELYEMMLSLQSGS